MGQRATVERTQPSIQAQAYVATGVPRLSVFPTDLGWFALGGRGTAVTMLTIGHGTEHEAREAAAMRSIAAQQPRAARRAASGQKTTNWVEDDWHPQLRLALQRYAWGERIEFAEYEIEFPPLSDFQRRVVDTTRRISWGVTLTYAELAARSGTPGAARAVGNVMASNRVPILVPCHRVVASSGRLGGFSAPQGVGLKRRMLDLEAGEAAHKG